MSQTVALFDRPYTDLQQRALLPTCTAFPWPNSVQRYNFSRMLAIFNKNKVETATQAISTLFFVLQKSLEAETDTSQNHNGMNGSKFVEVGL